MTADLPTIDVVIPATRWDHIGATLDAVTAQEGVNARPIVVNDSGKPAPVDVAERAFVVDTPGWSGEGLARAAGLAAVEAEHVAFCDDNDRWLPEKLQTQIGALAGRPGWCLVGAVRVDENDRVIAPWSLDALVDLHPPPSLPQSGTRRTVLDPRHDRTPSIGGRLARPDLLRRLGLLDPVDACERARARR